MQITKKSNRVFQSSLPSSRRSQASSPPRPRGSSRHSGNGALPVVDRPYLAPLLDELSSSQQVRYNGAGTTSFSLGLAVERLHQQVLPYLLFEPCGETCGATCVVKLVPVQYRCGELGLWTDGNKRRTVPCESLLDTVTDIAHHAHYPYLVVLRNFLTLYPQEGER
jgi:hypothetical protein